MYQTSVDVVGPYSYQLQSELPGDQFEVIFAPRSTLVKLYNVSASLCCGAKFGKKRLAVVFNAVLAIVGGVAQW